MLQPSASGLAKIGKEVSASDKLSSYKKAYLR